MPTFRSVIHYLSSSKAYVCEAACLSMAITCAEAYASRTGGVLVVTFQCNA